MKKILSALIVILAVISLLYLFHPTMSLRVGRSVIASPPSGVRNDDASTQEPLRVKDAINLLKARKDKEASTLFEKILQQEPENLQALWGKAEILRRSRKFTESEAVLNKIFEKDPDNGSALITLTYIRYMENNFKQALKAINRVLKLNNLERENRALAYMMLGTINSGRSAKGWLLKKINYGMKIQSYFLKAKEIAPELPEVYLGLGTFYLKAPSLMGGNIDKSIEQLEAAVKLTPEFATANARLAQAYKKKGNLDKYNFYLQKATELDPGNEVLIEMMKK